MVKSNKSVVKINRQWKILKIHFVDSLKKFCATTQLHGFSYLVSKSCTRLERIFWIIVVILSFIVGIVLVLSWDVNTPVITITETTTYNSRNIRFPAVTICSFNAISKKKSLKLARTLLRPKNVTDLQLEELFLLTINEKYQGTTKFPEKKLMKIMLADNGLTVGGIINSLQPSCMEMFVFCLWEGRPEKCKSLFQPIAFETNICCSMNFLALKRHTERSIPQSILKLPLKSYGAGYGYGLTIGMNSGTDDYFGTTTIVSRGFSVYIHDTFTHPISSKSLAVVRNRENFVQIIPSTTYTTAEYNAVSPLIRKCLLPHERKMKLTKFYTTNNCLFECESLWRIKICGCLFPLMIEDPSKSNCTLEQYWCLMRLLTYQDEPPKDTPKSLYCHCLPECHKNSYDTLLTAGRLAGKVTYSPNTKRNVTNFDTLVHVFFGETMTKRHRRDISEDWFTTLSSYGGLLSLVMGFSIVSVLEFIYILICQPNIQLVEK